MESAATRVLGVLVALSAATGCGLVLDLDPRQEEGFDAQVPAPDAGAADAEVDDAGARDAGDLDDADITRPDACGVGAERCNGLDEDCDGSIDETFELSSDPTHCGSCEVTCGAPPNAVPTCEGGTCGFACGDGYIDCDESASNGCESDVTSSATCGGCTPCAAEEVCVESTVGVYGCAGRCPTGTIFCVDGCVNVSSDVRHCGACGSPCASGTDSVSYCSGGACFAMDCPAGFLDCDGLSGNGCEVNLSSDPSNCGSCGNTCAGGSSCVAGDCR